MDGRHGPAARTLGMTAPADAPDARPHALGIDLGGTKIHAALFDADGFELWHRRTATPAGDYAGTLEALADVVRTARLLCPAAPMSVGIGGPGAESVDGTIKNANSTCLNGKPLTADLAARIGHPVRYANDANCLALSEATDGAGAGAEVVFAAILGTGTGAGISVKRQVLTGPHRLAGEWGHNPLPWPDDEDAPPPPCYCGRQGCVEAYVSGPAISRDHERRTGRFVTARQIAAEATRGDAAAQATLERHARRLARALAGIINLLDPDVVVLGGGLSLMPHLYERVPQLWTDWVFRAGARDPVRTRLVPARHGDASGVRGAAWLGR